MAGSKASFIMSLDNEDPTMRFGSRSITGVKDHKEIRVLHSGGEMSRGT